MKHSVVYFYVLAFFKWVFFKSVLATHSVINVKSAEDYTRLTLSSTENLSVIFFTADPSSCHECSIMFPVITDLANKYNETTTFLAVDIGIEALQVVADLEGITSIPAIILKKRVGYLTGIVKGYELQMEIEKNM